MPLLEVKDLKMHFPVKKGLLSRTVNWVRAVNGVTFHLEEGETLGLVGESGCGKTTVGRCLLRLIEATAGEVFFEGVDILGLSREELRKMRSHMQIIFQDPYSSLNPRLTVGQTLVEPLRNYQDLSRNELKDRVDFLMAKVGLLPDQRRRYPHEFSGGQRQRIGIARALALNPKVIVCDEPVSALDVSIQAQVINLLVELQEEMGLSYLFIAHDLSVVEHFSVEMTTDWKLYHNPQHPYTQALLSASPIPEPGARKRRIILEGDVPSPLNPPPGCAFHTRCPEREDACTRSEPSFRDLEDGHFVACHRR
jgi:oligopeptide/dipeptide ABC transporter ATP-binding protein